MASGAGDGGVGGCIDDDLQAVRGGRGDDQGQVEHRYEHRRGALGVLAHRWHWLAAVLRATATKRRPTSLLRRSRSALLHQLSFPLSSRFLALWVVAPERRRRAGKKSDRWTKSRRAAALLAGLRATPIRFTGSDAAHQYSTSTSKAPRGGGSRPRGRGVVRRFVLRESCGGECRCGKAAVRLGCQSEHARVLSPAAQHVASCRRWAALGVVARNVQGSRVKTAPAALGSVRRMLFHLHGFRVRSRVVYIA